jgi:hypothetical protein
LANAGLFYLASSALTFSLSHEDTIMGKFRSKIEPRGKDADNLLLGHVAALLRHRLFGCPLSASFRRQPKRSSPQRCTTAARRWRAALKTMNEAGRRGSHIAALPFALICLPLVNQKVPR